MTGIAIAAAVGGCKSPTEGTDLVGVYSIKGVLTENSCGQTALPVANPLEYRVEIREKDGVGYWVPTKQSQNLGSLNAEGEFRFSLTQTLVAGMAAPPLDQPGDFFPASNGQNDPDLVRQNQAGCVLTLRQTVSGSLRRRNAADGGGVVELGADAAADLSADNVIDVVPATSSNCNDALAAFGGIYLALPCSARYVMRGTLAGAEATNRQDDSASITPASSGGTAGSPVGAAAGTSGVGSGGTGTAGAAPSTAGSSATPLPGTGGTFP